MRRVEAIQDPNGDWDLLYGARVVGSLHWMADPRSPDELIGWAVFLQDPRGHPIGDPEYVGDEAAEKRLRETAANTPEWREQAERVKAETEQDAKRRAELYVSGWIASDLAKGYEPFPELRRPLDHLEAAVLGALLNGEEHVDALATRLRHDRVAVLEAVNRLQAIGLVERGSTIGEEGDSIVAYWRLTDAGRPVADELAQD